MYNSIEKRKQPNSIASDIYEVWIIIWNYIEKITNKIKNLISKK